MSFRHWDLLVSRRVHAARALKLVQAARQWLKRNSDSHQTLGRMPALGAAEQNRRQWRAQRGKEFECHSSSILNSFCKMDSTRMTAGVPECCCMLLGWENGVGTAWAKGLKWGACMECSSNIWGTWFRMNDRGEVGDGGHRDNGAPDQGFGTPL